MKGFMYEAYELLEASGQTSLKRVLVNIAINNGLTFKYKWLNNPTLIHIHHIDLNHDNNEVSNLSLMYSRKHIGLHNTLRSPKVEDKVETARLLHDKCVEDGYAFPVVDLLTEFVKNINTTSDEDEQITQLEIENAESQR